jgi:hypothetical protein
LNAVTRDGELVKPVYVGRLQTVNDWRIQIAKIFREMRKGDLPHDHGTKLTYVAQIGAQLAKVEEELRENQRLRERLERYQAGGSADVCANAALVESPQLLISGSGEVEP